MNMKKKLMKLLLATCCLALLCSCDPGSAYYFTVQNMTNDTVSVNMHLDRASIDCVKFGGDKIYSHDQQKWQDDLTVVLHKKQKLSVKIGNRIGKTAAPMDEITPLWKFIQSIKIGENALKPEKWNNEVVWNRSVSGPGGRGSWKGENIFYDLKVDSDVE